MALYFCFFLLRWRFHCQMRLYSPLRAAAYIKIPSAVNSRVSSATRWVASSNAISVPDVLENSRMVSLLGWIRRVMGSWGCRFSTPSSTS